MRQTKWFATPNEASAFIAGKSDADFWPSDGGWTVSWDEPEPPSAFERIVSRNGGEPECQLPDPFDYTRNTKAAHSDAPAEIVQRHTVMGIWESYDGPDKVWAFTVSLRPRTGPYDELRYFAMSKEEAQQFKVGSIIEVVLRPAPLA